MGDSGDSTAKSMWQKVQNFVSVFQQVDTYLVNGKPLLYGIGVDGSALSKKTFKTACLMAAQADRLYVMYVDDPHSKKPMIGKSSIERDFSLLAHEAKKEVVFYFETKGPDESLCEALMRLVDRLALDFVCLGAYGTSAEGEVEMKDFLSRGSNFGKVSDESLRSTPASLVLVKTTTFEIDPEKRVWVLATDHSPAAQAAFALLLRRMVKKGDELHILYASDVVSHTTILEMYDLEMKAAQVNGKIVFLQAEAGSSVIATITGYTQTAGADFLVIGCSGFGNSKLGSVSMGALRTARCATVIIKDPRDVAVEREERAKLPSSSH